MIRRTALLAFLCITTLAPSIASAQFIVTRSNRFVTAEVSGVEGTRVLLFDNRMVVDASQATIRSDYGPATVADLQPGMRVTASFAPPRPDGTFPAYTINILSNPAASLTAMIDRIDFAAGTMRIANQTVRFNSSTVVRRNSDGATLPVTDLRPLMHVLVEFDRTQPGLTASIISFSPPAGSGTSTIGGFLTAIRGDRWTIGFGSSATVVRVTADTYIAGSPRVGDRVHVTFRGDAAGDLVAVAILKITEIGPDDVAGPVTEIEDRSISVEVGEHEVRLEIDAQTVFPLGRPLAGDPVVVRPREDNPRFAAAVEPVTMTDFTSGVTGPIDSIAGNLWSVRGMTFYTTRLTRIVGSPGVGDNVEVLAMVLNDREYAVLITKL